MEDLQVPPRMGPQRVGQRPPLAADFQLPVGARLRTPDDKRHPFLTRPALMSPMSTLPPALCTATTSPSNPTRRSSRFFSTAARSRTPPCNPLANFPNHHFSTSSNSPRSLRQQPPSPRLHQPLLLPASRLPRPPLSQTQKTTTSDASANERLIVAVEENDVEGVRKALADGADPNSRKPVTLKVSLSTGETWRTRSPWSLRSHWPFGTVQINRRPWILSGCFWKPVSWVLVSKEAELVLDIVLLISRRGPQRQGRVEDSKLLRQVDAPGVEREVPVAFQL